MADESIHELTAAYALHALEERDAAEYEAHLAVCESCRAELVSFSETAAALAYAPQAPQPPAGLRARILDAAVRERSNVVPLRSRRPVHLLVAAAAVAASVAIGLGVWAGSLNDRLHREQNVSAERAAVLELASAPGTRRVTMAGGRGTLLVARDGSAALVLNHLPAAPAGRTYEAWVIAAGAPRPAGLFQGGRDAALRLLPPVPRGAAVAVTIERSGGASAPTGKPIVQAQA